jgi:tRNA 2-selenouridine synthase
MSSANSIRCPSASISGWCAGPRASGKAASSQALGECGAQVLDLEEMAAHMGSVLGAYPDRPQPPRKLFETRIWHALRGFDPVRPVFLESESKKIGNLHTPEILLERMRNAPASA